MKTSWDFSQISAYLSLVRFRLVAHQNWDIAGEAEIVSLSQTSAPRGTDRSPEYYE